MKFLILLIIGFFLYRFVFYPPRIEPPQQPPTSGEDEEWVDYEEVE